MVNFCSNCGSKISKSAQFCSNCGASVKAIKVEVDIPKSINIDATIKKERRKKRKPIISKQVYSRLKNYFTFIKKIISKEIYLIIFKYSLFTVPIAFLLNITTEVFEAIWCEIGLCGTLTIYNNGTRVCGYGLWGYPNAPCVGDICGGFITPFSCMLETRLLAVFLDFTIFIVGVKLGLFLLTRTIFPFLYSVIVLMKNWYIKNSN